MKRHKAIWTVSVFLFAASMLLGAGSKAYAVSFGPDCGAGNCFGSVYTLTSTFVSSTNGQETHDFELTVDTAGYNGPGSGLDAVAIKTSSSVLATTLLAKPATFEQAVISGLSANGCGVGTSSGFVCTQSSNLGGVAVPDGTYAFTFRNTFTSGTLLAQNEWSIKALYVDADGKQAGLTSVSGGTVPIPSTLLLFGAGFASFVMWHRRYSHFA